MTRLAVWILFGWLLVQSPFVQPARAMMVTQLELTGGAVNVEGRQGRLLDRLIGQDGTLVMGEYQPMGDIVPSIARGHRMFSLFTSGLNGEAAPSATISGSSITVDLSSLFVGSSRGNGYHISNIGGLATGLFNPETREFSLSWQHVFNRRWHERSATFFLKGIADVGPQPVAIPTSLVLYATGFFGLGSWTWWRRRIGMLGAA